MKELSLNILDIAENSVKAEATAVGIFLTQTCDELTLVIEDNGRGMSPGMLKNVSDPFCTTRATRKVGMGIPLLKLAAEQTGGTFSIESRERVEGDALHGTRVTAEFFTNHIDCEPLGDLSATLKTLIAGHPNIDFYLRHKMPGGEVVLDTKELRGRLGDVPLDVYEVLNWIEEYLRDQYENTATRP